MPIQTYTDRSSMISEMEAGFEFEFNCAHCSQRWVSDYKPYRLGQLTGLLNRFMFVFNGAMDDVGRLSESFSDVNMRKAHDAALEAAQHEADHRFKLCHQCSDVVCNDCYADEAECCKQCRDRASGAAPGAAAGGSGGAAAAAGGATCPNCNTATAGGRFCPECGFDMASSHKSCPSCGTVVERQARFCTDCGHSF